MDSSTERSIVFDPIFNFVATAANDPIVQYAVDLAQVRHQQNLPV